jgi:hypothetical protein
MDNARRVRDKAETLGRSYSKFTASLSDQNVPFWQATVDAESAGEAAAAIERFLDEDGDFVALANGLPKRIARIKAARNEAKNKLDAIENILNGPQIALFSESMQAELIGASEDLQMIRGALSSALDTLVSVNAQVKLDKEWLEGWQIRLFQYCLRGGACEFSILD